MAQSKETIDYVKNGKRLDGRKVDQLRDISIEVGVIDSADGSAYLEWGQNKVMVGVYGPRETHPRRKLDPTKAVVNYHYRMATFSVPDRKQPRPARREIEISKVSSEALERSLFLERFPNTGISVFAEILDSNAGSRCAALAAASCALADAGIPMRDFVSATGVGRAGGHAIVDLDKDEEDAPDAIDIALGILPRSEEIVLLQMDGVLPRKEWADIIELGIKSCKDVHKIQEAAVKKAFKDAEKTPAVKE